MEMKQHPLSAAFPAMSADDFQALKDDIESNGQREPIITHEGMVLDGWHRYTACIELGIKPKQFTFSADDDPASFVESANLHRRHLTASQRAVAVVKVRAWAPAGKPHEKALKSNMAAAATLPATNEILAREAKVSPRTIRDAKATVEAGLDEVVRDGGMTVEEAAQVARGTPAAAPKPAATPAPAPVPAQDFGPSDAEIASAQREQEEEVAALMKLAAADDKLAAAIAECKQLRALNRVLTERNNGLMNEKAELVKRVTSLQRKLDKLEKATA